MDKINWASIKSNTEKILNPVFNQYVAAVFVVLFILYSPVIVPQPCENSKAYLQHPLSLYLVSTSAAYIASNNLALSMTLGGALSLIYYVKKNRILEQFQGPKTMIYPGCMNITVFDLLESFGNDKAGLLSAMNNVRVPSDLELSDDTAPLIGTYLMSFGYKIKAPCEPAGANQKISSWL